MRAAFRLPETSQRWRTFGAFRKDFHPQLVDLWSSHPALRAVQENRHFPKTGGAALTQTHHNYPGPVVPLAREQLIGLPRPEILDLCEDIKKHGKPFRPLVRNSYALHCGLRVLFLRKEAPGKVYQGGDIDGRMKTLLRRARHATAHRAGHERSRRARHVALPSRR